MAVHYDWEIARKNMRLLRKKAGYSQEEMAQKIYSSISMICLYEKGATIPKIDYIERFCVYFGIGLDDLYEPDLIKGVLNL